MRIAIWMEDAGRARDCLPLVAGGLFPGRWYGASRRELKAGLDALEGRLDQSATGFRSAATSLRDLDVPLELGYCLLEWATLIGPDDPAARAAAAEAREIFTRLGSPPLLARLDEGLARRPSSKTMPRRASEETRAAT